MVVMKEDLLAQLEGIKCCQVDKGIWRCPECLDTEE
jgi:hypothetical protein